MPGSADAQGRIRCKACSRTLLWLKDGIVEWTFRMRSGESRTVGYPASSPALKDLLVICECGVRWLPTAIPDALVSVSIVPPRPDPRLRAKLRQFAVA